MEEKTKKKKTHFFEIYISKVLKQVSENCGITSNAKQQLNSFLCFLSKYLSKIIIDLTIYGKKKTISDKEIINSLSLTVSGELLKNSILAHSKRNSEIRALGIPPARACFCFGKYDAMTVKSPPQLTLRNV